MFSNQPLYNNFFQGQQNYQGMSIYTHIVQNYNVVYQAVVELTHLLNQLQDKIMKLERNEVERNEYRNVQKHVQILHCKYCDEVFDENWKLELHLKSHEESKQFQCGICNKTFLAKWRLKKHEQNHFRKNIKKCRFFKKGKFCPFQEVGCKFLHEPIDQSVPDETAMEEVPTDQNDSEEESIEFILKKAEAFENDLDTETDSDNEESIESIMKKVKGFEKSDAESFNECQGCGKYQPQIICAECDNTFCDKCTTSDHTGNRHMCLNCEIESDAED